MKIREWMKTEDIVTVEEYRHFMMNVLYKLISDIRAKEKETHMDGVKMPILFNAFEAKYLYDSLKQTDYDNEWQEYIQKVNKTNAELISEIERLKAEMGKRKVET